MNYRHRFHAGNVADVFKHYVLGLVLDALRKKPTPFAVLDSHAGAGLYTLRAPGEFQQGIEPLWRERHAWPALQSYFSAVDALNAKAALRRYPGSPYFIAEALRRGDRAVLVERQPQEFRALRAMLRDKPGVSVREADAWEAILAFVAPKENRGLVLIDPPYEDSADFTRTAEVLARALKRWRNGIYMVWYPIKAQAPVRQLHAALNDLAAPGFFVEFLTLPPDVEQRLNGSGIVLVNPPYGLRDTLQDSLPPLAAFLAGPDGAPAVRLEAFGPGA